MLAIVLLAFLLVFVADYVYVAAFAAHRGLNKQGDSGRRKIFHFVPLVCVPIVVNFNYRLFSLMAIGSYYLFWLI